MSISFGDASIRTETLDPGGMAERIERHDWSSTPLGPAAEWSPALRMMTRFMLANRFPMLLWWGPSYICLYNDAYVPILGSKHPTALGKPTEQVWGEIWDVLKPLIDTPFTGGPSTWNDDLEVELVRHDFAEETHFTIAYSPVPDDTVPSGIGGVLATVVETTEKVVAERRVAALRDIANATADPTRAADPCAAAASAIAQHPKDIPFALLYLVTDDGEAVELCGATGLPANSAQRPERIDLGLGRADGGAAWPIQQVLATHATRNVPERSGPVHDLQPTAVLLPIPSASPTQPLGVLVAGISPHIRMDDRYQAFLELVAGQIGTAVANARSYDAERRRAEALAELDRAKTVFFSNVSHEFRTPLTMMLGPIHDLLGDSADDLTDRQREQLGLAERSSRRFLKLVNALLEFSRLEAGRIEASFEPTDLAAMTEDLAGQFRSAIEGAGLTLDVEVGGSADAVFVDREMWEKMVLNLLSNALKSTFDGGITVRLRSAPDAVTLEVADTGIGISEVEQARIFERFHRINQARSRTHEGSGIGLSLVRELARLHGGDVSVESQPGEGTTFRVRIPTGSAHLPAERVAAPRALQSTAVGAEAYVAEALAWLPDDVAPQEDDAFDLPPTEHTGTAANEAPLAEARLLVVDDNADMRRYVSRQLARHWTVDVAADGRAGLEAMRANRYDLVLADVMMPNVDGLEMLATVRRDPALRDTPVILVSARAGEESRIESAAAGADDYVVKPFSSRELVARVRGALRLAAARRQANETLRLANEELRAALAVKDEFLGLVSHELRTPLTVILGMSKILERIGASDERAREVAADVAESADVLNGLVESMLLLARMTRDEAAMLREPVLLRHAVMRVLEERRRRDHSRSYELSDDGASALVNVQPTWLERVIDNFVGNAAKYSDPGLRVLVRVDTVGERARLRVIDGGPGIDEHDIERVFEPFYRTASARQRASGAGLGLAVAKRIIDLMDGRIWAARTPEGGSEFGFELPLVTEIEP